MDHPGVMAACVRDLAIMLQTIAGPDPLDPPTLTVSWPETYQAAAGVTQKPARLIRLGGIFRDQAEPEVNEMMTTVIKRLTEAGVPVEERALPAAFAVIRERHRTLMSAESFAYHESRLRTHAEEYGPNIRSLMEEARQVPTSEMAKVMYHRSGLIADMELHGGRRHPADTRDARSGPQCRNHGRSALQFPLELPGLPHGLFSSGLEPGRPPPLDPACRPPGRRGQAAGGSRLL